MVSGDSLALWPLQNSQGKRLLCTKKRQEISDGETTVTCLARSIKKLRVVNRSFLSRSGHGALGKHR